MSCRKLVVGQVLLLQLVHRSAELLLRDRFVTGDRLGGTPFNWNHPDCKSKFFKVMRFIQQKVQWNLNLTWTTWTETRQSLKQLICFKTWKNNSYHWVASIALWYHLHLPSCGRGFESQTHHLHFFNLYYWNCNEKRTKINKKRPGLTHFYKKSCLVQKCNQSQ